MNISIHKNEKVSVGCQVLTKFSFSGSGGSILGHSKLKVASPDQMFIFREGGGYSWPFKTQSAKT